MTEPGITESLEYANLIAEICKLSGQMHDRTFKTRQLECEVFKRLGYEVRKGKWNWEVHIDGHWSKMPQILADFGSAVRFTIGNRYGSLDRPLEANWYISQMCEDSEVVGVTGKRIATWAVRLAKHSKTAVDASAMTPAAALIAAWLRTHP